MILWNCESHCSSLKVYTQSQFTLRKSSAQSELKKHTSSCNHTSHSHLQDHNIPPNHWNRTENFNKGAFEIFTQWWTITIQQVQASPKYYVWGAQTRFSTFLGWKITKKVFFNTFWKLRKKMTKKYFLTFFHDFDSNFEFFYEKNPISGKSHEFSWFFKLHGPIETWEHIRWP